MPIKVSLKESDLIRGLLGQKHDCGSGIWSVQQHVDKAGQITSQRLICTGCHQEADLNSGLVLFLPKEKIVDSTVEKTNLEGVFVVRRPVNDDHRRGFFIETFRLNQLEQATGQVLIFEQGNHSRSENPGVLRGLHVAPWSKLVHCYRGIVYQVVVDCRKDSSTYGEVFTTDMGENNMVSVYVPPGCANGFLVRQGPADYGYNVTQEYSPIEIGYAWNSPAIMEKINWPLTMEPILSAKDLLNQPFEL